MSFEIDCPNCGPRPLWEFHFGGAARTRPAPDASSEAWAEYVYLRPNVCGDQTEWWYHRSACKLWFVARRSTMTNEVHGTSRYQQEASGE